MRAAALALAALLAFAAEAASAAVPMRFTAMDQTAVRVYFAAKPVVWTGLTPDQTRRFGRGKPLPPSVVVNTLPRELLARLPARRGFAYGRIGADVVLIESATGVVVDVIENVFR